MENTTTFLSMHVFSLFSVAVQFYTPASYAYYNVHEATTQTTYTLVAFEIAPCYKYECNQVVEVGNHTKQLSETPLQ